MTPHRQQPHQPCRRSGLRVRVPSALSALSALCLALGLALTGAAVHAQPAAAAPDTIDAKLDVCLQSSAGQTTVGMVTCTGEAIRAWDKRLNETYQQALAALDPTSRNLLRAAQRQWLTFRNAELAAQKGPWSAERGSAMRVQLMAAQLAAIKARVDELQLYLP